MTTKIENAGMPAPKPSGTAGGKVSDEAYKAMTPAQRLDYARQFDQSQFTNGR